MDTKKLGRQTVRLTSPPSIAGFGSAVGKKEGQGPLGRCFDFASQDDSFAEKSWEKAETAMQKQALSYALDKAGISSEQLDYVFAGDLLNQCIATSYSLRAQNAPFFGLYGACSTMAEGMSLAAMLVDGGFASYAGPDLLPFLLGGAPVPQPSGVWWAKAAHRPMDHHRVRRCHSVPQRNRSLYYPYHHRQSRRQGDYRRQQHGGCHGPCRLRHTPRPF